MDSNHNMSQHLVVNEVDSCVTNTQVSIAMDALNSYVKELRTQNEAFHRDIPSIISAFNQQKIGHSAIGSTGVRAETPLFENGDQLLKDLEFARYTHNEIVLKGDKQGSTYHEYEIRAIIGKKFVITNNKFFK